ncbi:hypothetical protein EV183_003096 [Coemansia sp. RSA 2336]|nr:hypothetical protein EV183_003096 [Coemansia sp. RSA 2336]
MRTGPHLEIKLDQPELLLRGSFDEAAAVLLSGRLIVHLNEVIKVRSLRLTMTGRIDTFLNQNLVDASVCKDTHRSFFDHTWQFLAPQKHPEQWGPQQREYPFDIYVPGDNPETIHTALGKVRYQLQATLERTGFHTNLAASREVLVKRGPMPGAPWALALMESIEAAGQWQEQLEYRVSVPTRSLKDGEVFQTKFEVEPRAKGLQLVSVGVLIKEYVRYYSSAGTPLHRFTRIVARNENYISPQGVCSVQPRAPYDCLQLVDTANIHIPLATQEAFGFIQYDVTTELIEVRHRIKFLIKVRDQNRMIHSIFIGVPVSIMPVTARDDSNLLPRYESAVRNPGSLIMRSDTLPPSYDAATLPATCSAGSSSSSSSGADGLEPGEDADGLEPGEDVDGFPNALRRSRSQFYLASPDHSPLLSASDANDQSDASTAVQLPLSASQVSAPASNAASTSTLEAAGSSRNLSCQSLQQPQRRRYSAIVSAYPNALHERLANSRISDKVRSIFHARSSSAHHRRSCSNLRCGGSHQPGSSDRAVDPPDIPRPSTPPPQPTSGDMLEHGALPYSCVLPDDLAQRLLPGKTPISPPPQLLVYPPEPPSVQK